MTARDVDLARLDALDSLRAVLDLSGPPMVTIHISDFDWLCAQLRKAWADKDALMVVLDDAHALLADVGIDTT